MRHHSIVRFVRNHRTVLTRLRVHVRVQVLHNLAKVLLGLFVQVTDGDTRRKHSVVGVGGGFVGSSLGSEIIELHGRNTLIDTINDLASDLDRVHVIHVETVAKLSHPGSHLVEFDLFLTSV